MRSNPNVHEEKNFRKEHLNEKWKKLFCSLVKIVHKIPSINSCFYTELEIEYFKDKTPPLLAKKQIKQRSKNLFFYIFYFFF